MLTLLFIICFFAVFGKLLMFGIKAAWGISKFLLTIVLLPVILIGLVVGRSDLSGIPDSNCCGNCRIAAVMQ